MAGPSFGALVSVIYSGKRDKRPGAGALEMSKEAGRGMALGTIRPSQVCWQSWWYISHDYTAKGWLVAMFIKWAHHLIRSGVKLCPGFAFKGREYPDEWKFRKKHLYAPRQLAMQDFKSIGEGLLVTGKGGFVKESFDSYLLKSKYDPLFLNNNGRNFTRT